MTVAELTQSNQNVEAVTILQRSVCLTLERHYFGNYRTVDPRTLITQASDTPEAGPLKVDPKQFGATKKLVDQKILTKVMNTLEEAPAFLRRQAIPGHRVFGERTYIIPLDRVQVIEDGLREIQQRVYEEAAKAATTYETAVAAQRAALGPLYKARDYVSAGEFAQSFGLDWSYVSFQAPDRLETVNSALFESARAKHEQQLASAFSEVRLVLRENLLQTVQELAAKLAPAADGTKKTFRNTVLRDLNQFLDTFSFRNITDDDDLRAVVQQLRDVANGVDAERLRSLDDVRATVAAEIETATAQLTELVVPMRRAIRRDL